MTSLRKTLALFPIFYSASHCHSTIHGFLEMLFGGMFLWIPYWLAWWLSDGFDMTLTSTSIEAQCRPNFDDSCNQNLEDSTPIVGLQWGFGPSGYGLYSGSIRLDN